MFVCVCLNGAGDKSFCYLRAATLVVVGRSGPNSREHDRAEFFPQAKPVQRETIIANNNHTKGSNEVTSNT